jgi:membrane-bound ClpP family serine protease
MDFLLNSNVAYLILLAGIFLTFLAFATPGTGLLEISALFCLVLAGYAAYHLSVHWWALVILALSAVPFVMSVRRPKRGILLGISILLLILGSLFLFPGDGELVSVDPVVAVIASGLVSVSLWLMLRKSIEAMSKPAHDLADLVGQVGEARSKIYQDGNVYLAGEMWSARSEIEIPSGSRVRVVSREGFVLVVESINNHPNS